MFCSNCGKAIKDNSNFCEFCGHEVKKIVTEEKTQSKVNVRKKKPFFIGAIVIAVLIFGTVFVLEMSRVTAKKDALEAAMLFMEEQKYEPAIEAFNVAFIKGDNEPEHYLLQAKAYVEMGDLYGAQQTLQLGYANTKSEDLLYVEIWGPTQPFDLLISISDDDIVPNVRQKFIFSGNDIEAQYFLFGKVVLTNKYYYDESGRLAGCQIYDYYNYAFGAGNFLYLCPNDLEHCIPMKATFISLCYDFVYTQSDRIEVWSWETEIDMEQNEIRATEQELFATLYYENDKCVSMVTEEGSNTLAYDDNGRITRIDKSNGDQMIVGYSEKNGYIISMNNADYVLKFDNDGFNTAYYGELVEEEWRVTTENNKVTEIYWCEDLAYRFTYDEKGRVYKIEENYWGNERTVICTYNPYTKEEELWQVEFSTFDGETLTRFFDFDEEGRISEIRQGYDTITFSYDKSGRCTSYTCNQDDVYQVIYDELGRILDIERK